MKHVPAILAALAFSAGAARAQVETDTRERSGGDPLVGALEGAYAKVVEAVAPAVVTLWVTRSKDEPAPKSNNPFFGGGVFQKRPKEAPVSGTIWEADGHILTSYFNVGGEVDKIRVRLADGRELPARLLGFDRHADLALVKVEAQGLPALRRRAPLESLKVGTMVAAVGRAPDGGEVTLNPGILSAPARHGGKTVQMDARLNYGNVGGPLVDLEGRAIGITCKVDVKSAGSIGQNSGVSFAVTWDQVEKVLGRLKKGERLVGSGQPFLGVQGSLEEDEDADGVVIQNVLPGGSAEAAGIQQGDVILEFDGARVKTFGELRVVIGRKAIGDEVKVRLRRGDKEEELTLKLGERPGD